MAKLNKQNAPASTIADVPTTPPAAEKKAERKFSPKHKESRGVPSDWKSTWLALDLQPAEHERLHKVAKQRNVTVVALLQRVLKEQLAAKKEEFDTDASKWEEGHQPKAPATVEDAEKELARAQKRMATLQAQIDALKARGQ